MSELKTQPSLASVDDFLAALPDPVLRSETLQLKQLMEGLSGQPAVLWGKMVGFGLYHYSYASGHKGKWFRIGFATRKQNLTLYIVPGFEHFEALMQRLGKYKTGKSCLYVRRLADIDIDVLTELIRESLAYMAKHYPAQV
ncbi:MAG: DUF1801 domain-containing protein [Candidatus Sericytochromatia bacterium]